LGEQGSSTSAKKPAAKTTPLSLSTLEDNLRLDLAISSQLDDISRARIQRLIRQGHVQVDGKPIVQPSHRVKKGQNIQVVVPQERIATIVPEDIPLDVIYEDESVLVINKVAGMVVHPSAGHERGTVVNAAIAHDPNLEGIAGEIRPGVVHRLDKDTSGVLIMAKNELALLELQKQFKDREVEKLYFALVDGFPPTPEGRIETPIGRDPRRRDRMAVVTPRKGKEAITLYSIRERFQEHCLLNATPQTGRTHQIRVHLSFIGCPVAGDRVYGQKNSTIRLTRHFLHARTLKLRLPGEKKPRSFHADLPGELSLLLEEIRNK
jgi:23S rRNA pseudouridine1911/1915/1917 synthase